jgi:hypothetical protein
LEDGVPFMILRFSGGLRSFCDEKQQKEVRKKHQKLRCYRLKPTKLENPCPSLEWVYVIYNVNIRRISSSFSKIML